VEEFTIRKIQWESLHINDFEKNPAHSIRDDLDPDEDEEMIEELDNATTILTTGIGIIVKDDSMNSLRRIEHWICHTNFDINLQVLAFTDAFEGVETLTVVTRYQMIIGFGRVFDVPEVKEIREGSC
jgi:hypothetical protein